MTKSSDKKTKTRTKYSTKKPGKPSLKKQLADLQEMPPIRAAVKMILLNEKTQVEDWSFAVGAGVFHDYEKLLPEDKQEGDFYGNMRTYLMEVYATDQTSEVEMAVVEQTIAFFLDTRANCVMNERDRIWKHAKNVEAGISGGFLLPNGNKPQEGEDNATEEKAADDGETSAKA